MGVSLIKRLLAEDPESRVRVVDNLSGGTLGDLERVAPVRTVESNAVGPMAEPGVELLRADIRDADAAIRTAA